MGLSSVSVPDDFGKGENKKSRRARARREALFANQGGMCFWCSEQMEMNQFRVTPSGRVKANSKFASFEHLLPRSMGGYNHPTNIVLAHATCNSNRSKRKWPHDPIFGNGEPLPPLPPKARQPQRRPKPKQRNRIKAAPLPETMDILGRSRMLTKVGIET